MAIIKCNSCGDIITGDKRGTFIQCSCGKCAVDETVYYYRIIGNKEDFTCIDPPEDELFKNVEEGKKRTEELFKNAPLHSKNIDIKK